MKSNTKSKLIEIIDKTGPIRPGLLASKLNIEPQTVHKHLRDLISKGILEAVGSPPKTTYVISGRPDFIEAFKWVQSRRPKDFPAWICATRDVFSARLNQFVPLSRSGVPQKLIPLLIAVSGEIGNNSFDHNLGHWVDLPGCWFQFVKTNGRLWILIADRGRGIRQSLANVRPDIPSDQDAVDIAFKERISGRSPEQRGNGLKFVSSVVSGSSGRGLCCVSGNGEISMGDLGNECASLVKKLSKPVTGTTTLMNWELN